MITFIRYDADNGVRRAEIHRDPNGPGGCQWRIVRLTRIPNRRTWRRLPAGPDYTLTLTRAQALARSWTQYL